MKQKTKLGKGGHGQEAIDEKGRYTDETPADKLYQTISAESKNISKPIANSSPSNLKLKPNVNLNDVLAKIEAKKKYSNAIWFKDQKTSLLESYLHFAPKIGKLWTGALTLGEKRACIQHTSMPFGNSQLRASGGDLNYQHFTHDQKEHIKNLTSAINKSSLEQNVWLQRGIDSNGALIFIRLKEMIKEMPFNFNEEKFQSWEDIKQNEKMAQQICDFYSKKNPEIYDHGFASCGTAKNSGFSGGTFTFNIFCPKGTKAIYVDPVSEFGENQGVDWDGKIAEKTLEKKKKDTSGLSENETILQRGTHFRVMKMEYNKERKKFYVDLEVMKQLGE